MKTSLKILAVDDHLLFLKGIAECLNDLPFVARIDTCTDYASMKRYFQKSAPDVVFLDLNLPNYDGFNICRDIKKQYPDVFIAILTHYDSGKFIEKAQECGAGAYFIKNTDPEIIARFLEDLANGRITGFYFHVETTGVRGSVFNQDDFNLISSLSRREMEVLKLIVKGQEHEEIGKQLNISYETIKTHRSNVLQKLKLKNVAELVRFAVKNDLASVDS
jgi:DNA-binding NarL/FixJ family response regulator